MNLYISGSNRKQNCYRILNDLKTEKDKLISLADKSIGYCLGCSACVNDVEGFCVIEDDMQEIYEDIMKSDKIIIATPVYMNHITGILKNVIDRFNPFCNNEELLQDKTFYIIAIGQMSEIENNEIANDIKQYFERISEFLGFKSVFLRYLTSGDIKSVDDITKTYNNYNEIIKELKVEIEGELYA